MSGPTPEGFPSSPRTPISQRRVPRPFVKWVGGKSQLLGALRAVTPKSFGRYFEPFVGGGALFFDLAPQNAVLTDVNEELINAYGVIRDQVEPLIRALRKYAYDKDLYYETRAKDPRALEPVARAARTVFLNRTGFNGLYRVNKSGLFNVPFGRYDDPLICDEGNLRGCAKVLATAELAVRGFDAVLDYAVAGDFVYFDPPYLPASATADFTTYSASGFNLAQHQRLADVVRELVRRKVQVLLSNADVPLARDLYEGLSITSIDVSRSVSASAEGRVVAKEIIVTGRARPRGTAKRA